MGWEGCCSPGGRPLLWRMLWYIHQDGSGLTPAGARDLPQAFPGEHGEFLQLEPRKRGVSQRTGILRNSCSRTSPHAAFSSSSKCLYQFMGLVAPAPALGFDSADSRAGAGPATSLYSLMSTKKSLSFSVSSFSHGEDE